MIDSININQLDEAEIKLKIAEIENDINEYTKEHPLIYRSTSENLIVSKLRTKQNNLFKILKKIQNQENLFPLPIPKYIEQLKKESNETKEQDGKV